MYSKTITAFKSDMQLLEGAHILYTYKHEEQYIDNAVAFISKGLDLGQGVIVIEASNHYKSILKRLNDKGYNEELSAINYQNSVEHYLENDEFNVNRSVLKIKALVESFRDSRPVRIWGIIRSIDINDIIDEVKTYESNTDKELVNLKTLTVCAFDRNKLTGCSLFELMKTHDYVMTDSKLRINSLYENDAENIHAVDLDTIDDSLVLLKKNKDDAARLEKYKMISEMSGSISHGIRNPMTTIRGFLQLFLKKAMYKEDERFLNIIIEELDQANNLITEFLSLNINKPPELKSQCLNSIIDKITPLINAIAIESGKSVIVERKEIPMLMLDEQEICTALLKILQNALDATEEGGNVYISTNVDQGNVVVEIKDSGYGINKDIITKLGTPFITTKGNASGLGLAISYSILEKHNAEIDVVSNSNGTVFTIKFPLLLAIGR